MGQNRFISCKLIKLSQMRVMSIKTLLLNKSEVTLHFTKYFEDLRLNVSKGITTQHFLQTQLLVKALEESAGMGISCRKR